ncbi:hypothetical protein Bca4012_010646 [Brassica carinata]
MLKRASRMPKRTSTSKPRSLGESYLFSSSNLYGNSVLGELEGVMASCMWSTFPLGVAHGELRLGEFPWRVSHVHGELPTAVAHCEFSMVSWTWSVKLGQGRSRVVVACW